MVNTEVPKFCQQLYYQYNNCAKCPALWSCQEELINKCIKEERKKEWKKEEKGRKEYLSSTIFAKQKQHK